MCWWAPAGVPLPTRCGCITCAPTATWRFETRQRCTPCVPAKSRTLTNGSDSGPQRSRRSHHTRNTSSGHPHHPGVRRRAGLAGLFRRPAATPSPRTCQCPTQPLNTWVGQSLKQFRTGQLWPVSYWLERRDSRLIPLRSCPTNRVHLKVLSTVSFGPPGCAALMTRQFKATAAPPTAPSGTVAGRGDCAVGCGPFGLFRNLYDLNTVV